MTNTKRRNLKAATSALMVIAFIGTMLLSLQASAQLFADENPLLGGNGGALSVACLREPGLSFTTTSMSPPSTSRKRSSRAVENSCGLPAQQL